MYVRYLEDNIIPKTAFVALKALEKADASSIHGGHSIISGVSACFTYSNPDAIIHICSSKDECYLNQFLC